MKHARMFAPLALAALLVAPLVGVATRAEAAPKRSQHHNSAASSKSADYRQFTGTVVAVDESSITVERGGKSPKQMVFERNASLRSTGDVEKDARVTVYWRDEAGKQVAHRVVVKEAAASGGSR
jgi:gas vesicle protein